jgi:hypothetical protein
MTRFCALFFGETSDNRILESSINDYVAVMALCRNSIFFEPSGLALRPRVDAPSCWEKLKGESNGRAIAEAPVGCADPLAELQ